MQIYKCIYCCFDCLEKLDIGSLEILLNTVFDEIATVYYSFVLNLNARIYYLHGRIAYYFGFNFYLLILMHISNTECYNFFKWFVYFSII